MSNFSEFLTEIGENATDVYYHQHNEKSYVVHPITDYATHNIDEFHRFPQHLTHAQSNTVAYAPKVTAALSILGSGWIIYELLILDRRRINLKTTLYHRLILAMSGVDIMSSIWLFIGTWAVPFRHHLVPPMTKVGMGWKVRPEIQPRAMRKDSF